ncbi:hypothetical protein A4X13_0g7828 [Tilletia indica]|uniref:Peptidase A2 domain-containing protein n=1 Tax=Tilletia indica TaxID=43049 RepID=A0A8T8SHR4_9BASI|nr:hypothetical protein A4X13_0g7828 [Tilletia indica]
MSSRRTSPTGAPTRDEFTALDAARAKLDSDVAAVRTTLTSQGPHIGELQTSVTALHAKFDQLIASLNSSSGSVQTSTAPSAVSDSVADMSIPSSDPSGQSNSQEAPSQTGVSSDARIYAPSRTDVSDGSRSFTIKSEELGVFEGVAEDTALFLANVEAIRATESDPNWDKALLRAIPRTLHGPARLWFASLSDRERAAHLASLTTFLAAIRATFTPPTAVIGWPKMTEGELVNEVIEGIDPAVAKLVQTPFRNDPTLLALRTDLLVQETFWRKEFQRPLARPASTTNSATGVPSYASLIAPTASAFIGHTTPEISPSGHAYPQAPQTSSPARRSFNPRQGLSIRSDFNPANLSYRIHPELRKKMMAYKVPLTDRIMCREKPGEPPPPTALLAQPAPERRADGKGGWNYTPSDRCDPPWLEQDAEGYKSTVERVAPSFGPEEDLDGGYRKIPTPGPGRGHEPSPDQTTRGHPQGKYHTCLSNVTSDQSSTDDPSPPSHPATIDHQDSVLFLADHWLQHPAPLPSFAVSPKRPRGEIKDVELCRLDETGSGLGHLRHAPTSGQIQFLNADLAPVSCLVDTGASLSTIDAGLAKRLGQVPSGGTLSINGLGPKEHWASSRYPSPSRVRMRRASRFDSTSTMISI